MGKIYEALEWQKKEMRLKKEQASAQTFSIARFRPSRLKIRQAIAPHYEELKANFLNRYLNAGIKTVMFAGIEPEDGASTCAVYFASLLSRDGQHKVMLLDSNLRKPSFRRFFNTENSYSLRHLASGGRAHPIAQFLPPTIESGNLYVIPSGSERVVSNPLNFVQSTNFRQFMGDMRDKFDYTIIDGPALRNHPEGLHLSAMVDGVVLVVRAGKTSRWVVQNLKKQIEDAGGNVLGVVLNRRQHFIPNWLYRLI